MAARPSVANHRSALSYLMPGGVREPTAASLLLKPQSPLVQERGGGKNLVQRRGRTPLRPA